MIDFFYRSKNCAKKRLKECIKNDRKCVLFDSEKIREEIEAVLKKYVDLEGGITLKITTNNEKKYITAGAVIK